MHTRPPLYVVDDGLGPCDFKDPRIPRGNDYWPPGLPKTLAGIAEHMRCDARAYDYVYQQRHGFRMRESCFTAKKLWQLAQLIEDDDDVLHRQRRLG